jgi:uncharacterized protein (DUF1778 family)
VPQAVVAREAKKNRLEACLTPEQKMHIERAVQIRGTSISDFVVLSADEAALRTIREQEVLTLNERAREVFANADYSAHEERSFVSSAEPPEKSNRQLLGV